MTYKLEHQRKRLDLIEIEQKIKAFEKHLAENKLFFNTKGFDIKLIMSKMVAVLKTEKEEKKKDLLFFTPTVFLNQQNLFTEERRESFND